MPTPRTKCPRIVLLLLPLLLAMVPAASAYDTYSTNRTTGNCATCHGGFRTAGYVSKVDGQPWNSNLHDVHRNTMLNGDCETCHYGTRYPVYTHRSTGGTGLAAYSCTGCHGRAEDGTGSGTTGYGAGLRQRHWRAGQTVCGDCHADSNPANKTPVPENVKPPYYANPGTNHPAIPTDPCNPSPAYPENFAASTLGLDNDGNGQFDMLDAACGTTSTPGETGRTASQLRVTSYNKTTGLLTVSYGAACAASNNNVEYGLLSKVSTYTYSGQACGVGNTGSSSFTLPGGSYFFLLVGNNGTVEGSYGKRSNGAERPEDTGASCPVPQDLSKRCN